MNKGGSGEDSAGASSEVISVGSDTEGFSGKLQKVKLLCVGCGASGDYDVGTIFWELEGEEPKRPRFMFTKYFRCRQCNSPGPWDVLDELLLMGRIGRSKWDEEDESLVQGRCHLFDGSSFQTPAMGEEYILGLLEKDPKRVFLYTRLGNLLRGSGERALSAQWYEKAVALDPGEMEARHHLHTYALEREDYTEALSHASLLAENLLAGRRCEKDELTEGIAHHLAEDLVRYPRGFREDFLKGPEVEGDSPGRKFIRCFFRQDGFEGDVREQAVGSLLAGEASVLAGDPRFDLVRNLIDEELRTEYSTTEGEDVDYGLRDRTLKGFHKIRAEWQKVKAPTSDKLQDRLRVFQKEQGETIGSVRTSPAEAGLVLEQAIVELFTEAERSR